MFGSRFLDYGSTDSEKKVCSFGNCDSRASSPIRHFCSLTPKKVELKWTHRRLRVTWLADCGFLVIYFYALHKRLMLYCCRVNVFGTSDSEHSPYRDDSRCGMSDVAFRTAPTNWWAFLFYSPDERIINHIYNAILVMLDS